MTDVNKTEGGADEKSPLEKHLLREERQAIAKLEADLLAMVGEDEPINSYSSNPKQSIEPRFRNQLRAELRDKIKQYFSHGEEK